MDKESEIRAFKKDITPELLAWLRYERKEKHATFMENSHKIYRDEIVQWKAEVQIRLIDEIIEKINEFEEKYVSNDRGTESKVRDKGEEEKETPEGIDPGRDNST